MLEIDGSVDVIFLASSYLLARNYQRHIQRGFLLVVCQSLLETLAIWSTRNIVFLKVQN